MKNSIGTNHTTIMHGPRIVLGLTCNEYCIADMIYHLSRETGWCYASKERLGSFIGLTKQSALKIVSGLINSGVVEMHETNRQWLRTTEKWHGTVVRFKDDLYGKRSYQAVQNFTQASKDSTPPSGKQTSPYNYKIHKQTKSGFSSTEKQLSQLKEKNIELSIKSIRYPDRFTLEMLEVFSDRCGQQLDVRPVMKAAQYWCVIEAKKHFTEDQLRNAVEDWFYRDDIKDKDRIQISRALSPYRLNEWRVENP